MVVLRLFKDKMLLEFDGTRRVMTIDKTTPEEATLLEVDSYKTSVRINGETFSAMNRQEAQRIKLKLQTRRSVVVNKHGLGAR